MDDERNQWAVRREELTAETQDVSARLAGLDAQQRALDEREQQWTARQTETQRELDALAAGLDARLDRLQSREAEFEEQCREWETIRTAESNAAQAASPQEPAEPVCQPVVCEAPVNLMEILRRTGANLDFAEAEAEAESAGLVTVPQPPEPVASEPPMPEPMIPEPMVPKPPVASHGDDEESIDDYMVKLLERVRGGAPAGPSSYQMPASRPPTPPAPVAAMSEPAVPAAGGESANPKEMAPRAVAPEKNVNLSAIRELANLQAKSALTQHERRRLSISSRAKLLVTIVALSVGMFLIWARLTQGLPDNTVYAAAIAFTVAVFWGFQYFVVTGRLIVAKLAHIDATVKAAVPARKIELPTVSDAEAENR
jgi:hypothetical protein